MRPRSPSLTQTDPGSTSTAVYKLQAGGRHDMPPPSASWQYLCLFTRWRCCSGITISSYLFARWHPFRHAGYLRHQQQAELLTLKLVSESRVTWATSVPILVFLGFSVLELGPMYATDRCQTDGRQTKALLNASPYGVGSIIICWAGSYGSSAVAEKAQRCISQSHSSQQWSKYFCYTSCSGAKHQRICSLLSYRTITIW